MITNKDNGSPKGGTQHKHPLRDAFDRATRWFGNLLAPLVIIAYARNAQQDIEYLIERPLLTGSFALVFVFVLAYNVLRTTNVQLSDLLRRWRRKKSIGKDSSSPVPPEVNGTNNTTETSVAGIRRRSFLRWAAIAGSLVALIIVVYTYVLVFVTGVHFVAVASAPDKASAIREIQALNRLFKEKGQNDLEARTHASTANGSGWYMITIRGPHTSRKAAEATFMKAEQVMGPRMRPDAYIYSTEKPSPIRVIRNCIRSIRRWLIGGHLECL